ncbi:MAG: pentapeptide repeat-containing protein [Bdellovibrio sp.]|nr:pentapeptide repeat-containing protein [Bdellovibrio sp.]
MKTTTYAQTPNTQQHDSVYEIISNETLESCDFKGLTIAGSLFSLSVFKGITFKDCVFYGSKFENCMFTSCSFENCSFQFTQVDFCQFSESSFAECNWDFAPIKKSQFADCQLDGHTRYQVGHEDKANQIRQSSQDQDERNLHHAHTGLFLKAA